MSKWIRRPIGIITGGAGIRYLLRDLFYTDRAAGAVNGTACEPGPGTRWCQVASTSPLISDGWMVFGPWEDVDGEPGLWMPDGVTGLTVQQGITMVGRISGDGVNPIYATVGWDVDRGSHISTMGVIIKNNILLSVDEKIAYGTLDTSEVLDVAIAITASSGQYVVFVKSTTTFPRWTFVNQGFSLSIPSGLWISTNKSSNAYTQTHKCRMLAVPSKLYIPSPVVSDGFNLGEFGVSDGLGHAIDSGVGSGGSSITWTNRVGTWGLSGSRAKAATLSGGIAIATVPTGTPNPVSVIWQVFKGAGALYGYIGHVVRYKDANNYVRVTIGHDGTNEVLECTEVIAGTPTQLFKISPTDYVFSNGKRLAVIVNGQSLTALYDNASIAGASATLTLTGESTDEVGLYSTAVSASDTIEAFFARPRGNESQYSIYDNYFTSI